MNVQELIEETYHNLGEPTYLSPYVPGTETFDIGSAGAVRILGWLNRAYKRICSWKMANGKILRFRSTEQSLFFHGVSEEDTAAAGTDNTITFPAVMSALANRYRGWCIEITGGTGEGQHRIIVDYSATRVATVHKAWDTNPDATSTFKITKNFYDFLPATHAFVDDNISLSGVQDIISVSRIKDVQDGVTIARAGRTSEFNNIEINTGNPTLYKDVSGGILFNAPVQDNRYYEVKYYGYPSVLALADDIPQIPEAFHEGILLWMIWWGLNSLQEFSGAYSMKRNLEDTMASIIQQYEMSSDAEDISLEIGGDY